MGLLLRKKRMEPSYFVEFHIHGEKEGTRKHDNADHIAILLLQGMKKQHGGKAFGIFVYLLFPLLFLFSVSSTWIPYIVCIYSYTFYKFPPAQYRVKSSTY